MTQHPWRPAHQKCPICSNHLIITLSDMKCMSNDDHVFHTYDHNDYISFIICIDVFNFWADVQKDSKLTKDDFVWRIGELGKNHWKNVPLHGSLSSLTELISYVQSFQDKTLFL